MTCCNLAECAGNEMKVCACKSFIERRFGFSIGVFAPFVATMVCFLAWWVLRQVVVVGNKQSPCAFSQVSRILSSKLCCKSNLGQTAMSASMI